MDNCVPRSANTSCQKRAVKHGSRSDTISIGMVSEHHTICHGVGTPSQQQTRRLFGCLLELQQDAPACRSGLQRTRYQSSACYQAEDQRRSPLKWTVNTPTESEVTEVEPAGRAQA
ncbi:unnamed protein product [Phytophthora fragariaefolia]|uniref:Unnamed protein product n=1 Tax=Phytophthora fragariaefolia TaxID=1490495 RepID=A0A9W6YM32_9STRA|nr:unnamed protein product [Phytophthora fragariaefolia]